MREDSKDFFGEIATAGVFLSLTLVINKFFGFFKEMLIAKYFGASHFVDAYKVAIQIPQILSALLISGLALAFLPVFTEYLAKKKYDQAWQVARTLGFYFSIMLSMATAAGIIFAPVVINTVAPGFSHGRHLELGTQKLAVSLLRITMPYLLFAELGGFLQVILQSFKNYTLIILWQVIPNLILVLTITLFSNRFGMVPLSAGFALIGLAYFLLLLPGVIKIYREQIRKTHRPLFRFCHPGVRKVMKLMIPVLSSSSVVQLAPIIDRYLASYLQEGSISALEYAYRLMMFPSNIIVSAFSFVIFPLIASSFQEGEEKFRKTVVAALKMIFLLTLPALSVSFVLSLPITRLVYERGSFIPQDTLRTASVFKWYALGIVGLGGVEVMNRAFFSIQNPMTPLKISVIASLVNIIGSISLLPLLGLDGLAIASAVAINFNMLCTLWTLKRQTNIIFDEKMRSSIKSITLACITSGALIYLLLPYFETPFFLGSLEGRTAALGLLMSVFMIVYFLQLLFMKNDELLFMYHQLIVANLKKLKGPIQ